MRRFLIGVMAAVAAIGLGGVGVSAGGQNGQLQAFGTGTVTITGPDSATIVNAATKNGFQYGGVYVQSKSQSGELIGAASFSFTSTGDVTGGSPRFSIPINTGGGGGKATAWAFIDAAGCGGVSGGTTLVSTTNTACRVFFGTSISGYDNWDAFVAANPTYKIAQGNFPLIVADGAAGSYAISSISLT